MDDYLFDMDQFFRLQSEEAAERTAAAAAGSPQPDPESWAPPALPADMALPGGADVEAWYDAHEDALCHLVIDARVRGAQRLCPLAGMRVHVCWRRGAWRRHAWLESGTGGFSRPAAHEEHESGGGKWWPACTCAMGTGARTACDAAPRVRVLCLTRALRRRAGGVARFFNHSCDGGNMFAQTVLAEGDSALSYRVALFASRDIPAGTELTYDYKWDSHPNGRIECRCGSADCRGRLLPPLQ